MPRQSSGCLTCRRRKIKCDEAKPSCQRCTQYGVNCPGYQSAAEGRKFLKFKDQTKRVLQKAQADQGLSTSQVIRSRPLIPTIYNGVSIMPQMRTQIFSSFIDGFNPKGGGRDNTCYALRILVPDKVIGEYGSRESAVTALSLIHLAGVENAPHLLTYASPFYCTALRKLRQALSDPLKITYSEILATIAVLGFCEMFNLNNSDRAAWLAHVDGSQQYMLLKGIPSIDSAMEQAVFHNLRYAAWYAGISRRKATIFHRKEWLQASAKLSETEPWAFLMDTAVKIPALMEKVDALDPQAMDYNSIITLYEEHRRLQSDLRFWYYSTYGGDGFSYLRLASIEEFTVSLYLHSNKLFSQVFCFSTLPDAVNHIIYWKCSFLVQKELLVLNKRLSPLPLLKPEEILDMEQDMFRLVVNICKSVPYASNADTGSMGPASISAAIGVVYDYFYEHNLTEYQKWIQTICLEKNFTGIPPLGSHS